MDARGSAPRPSMAQEMADVLLSYRGIDLSPIIGKNQVTNYIKRHPNLSSRFSKRYNYEPTKCENPKIIGEWFTLVQETILQYSINNDDTYNFGETGFVIGLTAIAKVIIRVEYYGR